MNTALEMKVVPFELLKGNKKPARTNSPYKSNGIAKATKADPIRNPEDIAKMQEYFLSKGQYRNYMILTLGISFALRAGDLLSLKVKDLIDSKTGKPKEVFYIREDKTNKRNRVYINEKSREVLATFWQNKDYKIKDWDEPFFRSRTSNKGEVRAITITQLNRILKEAAKECGIQEHISSHSLRKTFGYHIMKKHENDQRALYALQYTYNHGDLRTTYIYTGIEDDVAAELREDMNDLFI